LATHFFLFSFFFFFSLKKNVKLFLHFFLLKKKIKLFFFFSITKQISSFFSYKKFETPFIFIPHQLILITIQKKKKKKEKEKKGFSFFVWQKFKTHKTIRSICSNKTRTRTPYHINYKKKNIESTHHNNIQENKENRERKMIEKKRSISVPRRVSFKVRTLQAPNEVNLLIIYIRE
jgi:hypothetical protein